MRLAPGRYIIDPSMTHFLLIEDQTYPFDFSFYFIYDRFRQESSLSRHPYVVRPIGSQSGPLTNLSTIGKTVYW